MWNSSGQEGAAISSLKLNHCMSDFLLRVDLQTQPSSTRIYFRSCQYLVNARDRGSFSCGVMSFLNFRNMCNLSGRGGGGGEGPLPFQT